MIVRQFNGDGIAAFRSFLEAARDNPSLPVPRELLGDSLLTQVLAPELHVETRRMVSKSDAASYLEVVLRPISDQEVAVNAGLWTWLSLFFFDEVCPPRNGQRSVKNDYHYVFEPKNSRHFYRHLLFISWRVSQVAPVHNRLFLNSPLTTLDKVTTEVMKRLFLTRIPCMFEVLDRLYWDERRGKARIGIVGTRPPKPGDLTHRLPVRIRQLERTYDLLSLNADQLIELLGDEFQRGGDEKSAIDREAAKPS